MTRKGLSLKDRSIIRRVRCLCDLWMLFCSIKLHFSSAAFLFVFCTVYGRGQRENLELKPWESRWQELCKTFFTFMKLGWVDRFHSRATPSVCTPILCGKEIWCFHPALILFYARTDTHPVQICRLGLEILMTFLSQQGRFLGGVNWCNTIEASEIIQIYPQHTPKQQ